MKTIRQYLSGCTWCSATGFVATNDYGINTTPLTETCPVCNGNKTVLVTETVEDDWLEQINNFRTKSWF